MVNYLKNLILKNKSKKALKDYIKYKEKKIFQRDINILINENLNKLKYYKNNFFENFYLNSFPNLNLIITQYLLNFYMGGLKIEKKILIGLSEPIVFRANITLLKNLSENLKIKFILSLISFKIIVIKNFFLGVIYYFYKIFEFFLIKNNDTKKKISQSSFFLSLEANCINDDSNSKLSTISDWYFNYFNNDINCKYLFHNCKKKNKN